MGCERWDQVKDNLRAIGKHIEEIRAAYRQLSLIHHPDAGGDRAHWERLLKAYQEGLNMVSV